MDAVDRLLRAGDGSQLAGEVRGWLVGWRAMLVDAAARCPGDPGLPAVVDLIRELDDLLSTPPVAVALAAGVSGAATSAAARAVPRSAGYTKSPPASGLGEDPGLTRLITAFLADPGVMEAIDDQSLAALNRPDDPDTEWFGLHLCLLRLPERVAGTWRDRAAQLSLAPTAWRSLPDDVEFVLVPARAAVLQPHSVGHRTAPDAPVDEEVASALSLSAPDGRQDPETAELGRLASLILGLANLDENLVVCLESTLYQGSRRLNEDLRQRYRADLIGRLGEFARSAPASAARFEALLDVDEAFNSLTHRPPPADSSWWARVHRRSRAMVDRSVSVLRHAGTDVEVMELGLKFRDVRDLTQGNDIGSRAGGEPGDVLACLRLWARIGGKVLPGRVMYRT